MSRSPICHWTRPLASSTVLVIALALGTSTGASLGTSVGELQLPNPETSAEGAVDPGRIDVKLRRVARVSRGTSLAFRRGDRTMYLARQGGEVVPITPTGHVRPPILDITSRIGTHREQGLLGLVFSPDGQRMYVYYTSSAGVDTLDEYRVAQKRRRITIDAAGGRTLLAVPHPDPRHNGGQLAFGPDRMLYVSVGDGGGHRGVGPGQVAGGNSQSLDNLLGKILRIDPTPSASLPYSIPADNPFAAGGGRPEIWQYGLRNPWRFSFDRETGDLWIGDVGQDHWEEINVLPAGARGVNFGYPLMEGTHVLTAPGAPGTALPVFELWHRSGNCAVTGGYVYRGTEIPNLRGLYIFADYCKGSLKALRQWRNRVVSFAPLSLNAPLVSSFGEGPRGELYVISQARGVLRIEPR